ncbi:MAG: rhomboid family intramembrane serine protease [Terriglobales bacterium]|jgi:membrane associated rhomboid family serine protease
MIPLRDETPRYSTPYVTYFIIALNVVVFCLELAADTRGQLDPLIRQFGVVPRRFTLDLAPAHFDPVGAFVPILTAMFLHASWLHIIGNMWVLWIFGDNIEDYLGHFPYLLFYLGTGVIAFLTHIALNPSSRLPTLGASGAIAGVMGAYFLLYPRARVLIWFPPIFFFHLPAWLVLGYWFLIQFLSGTATSIGGTGAAGGVAVWAHVGGFLAGMALIKLLPERSRRRYGAW